MSLPSDARTICEATWDGEHVLVTRGAVSVATTEPVGDPLASVCLQLAATVLQPLSREDRTAAGIFLATRHGCLQTDIEFDRSRRETNGRFVSPAAFRGTLPSIGAGEISVQLGIRGPAVTLLGTSDLRDLAMKRACAWIKHLKLRHALVGTFDAVGGDQIGATMQLLQRMTP